MAIKHQKSSEFGIVPFKTRDPSSYGCRVYVSLYDFEQAEIPQLGTRLMDANLNVVRLNPYWNNHTFAGLDDGPPGGVYFVFNPPVASADGQGLLTPFNFYYDTQDIDWPPVLFDLGAIQSENYSVTDGSAVSFGVIGRYQYVEGLSNFPTQVLLEEFMSNEAFSEEMMALDPPLPTPIVADYRGRDIRFPSCLHPRIVIDRSTLHSGVEEPSSYANVRYIDFLEGQGTLGLDSPYEFPATNHLRWRNYIKSFKVEKLDNNQYYGLRTTVIVPRAGRKVTA